MLVLIIVLGGGNGDPMATPNENGGESEVLTGPITLEQLAGEWTQVDDPDPNIAVIERNVLTLYFPGLQEGDLMSVSKELMVESTGPGRLEGHIKKLSGTMAFRLILDTSGQMTLTVDNDGESTTTVYTRSQGNRERMRNGEMLPEALVSQLMIVQATTSALPHGEYRVVDGEVQRRALPAALRSSAEQLPAPDWTTHVLVMVGCSSKAESLSGNIDDFEWDDQGTTLTLQLAGMGGGEEKPWLLGFYLSRRCSPNLTINFDIDVITTTTVEEPFLPEPEVYDPNDPNLDHITERARVELPPGQKAEVEIVIHGDERWVDIEAEGQMAYVKLRVLDASGQVVAEDDWAMLVGLRLEAGHYVAEITGRSDFDSGPVVLTLTRHIPR